MRLFVVVLCLCLSLTACEPEGAADNHGYGYGYDWQGQSGLRVRFEEGAARIPFSDIEEAYLDTIDCTALPTPESAPLVVFTGEDIEQNDYPIQGQYYYDTHLIVVMSLDEYPAEWSVAVFRHEAVHMLLHFAGASDDANLNHGSELFSECAST